MTFSELHLCKRHTDRKWTVTKSFSYVARNKELITVPVGFTTDLTTLWRERYPEASLIHDQCLTYKTRREARHIFDECLYILEANWLEHKFLVFMVWCFDQYRKIVPE